MEDNQVQLINNNKNEFTVILDLDHTLGDFDLLADIYIYLFSVVKKFMNPRITNEPIVNVIVSQQIDEKRINERAKKKTDNNDDDALLYDSVEFPNQENRKQSTTLTPPRSTETVTSTETAQETKDRQERVDQLLRTLGIDQLDRELGLNQKGGNGANKMVSMRLIQLHKLLKKLQMEKFKNDDELSKQFNNMSNMKIGKNAKNVRQRGGSNGHPEFDINELWKYEDNIYDNQYTLLTSSQYNEFIRIIVTYLIVPCCIRPGLQTFLSKLIQLRDQGLIKYIVLYTAAINSRGYIYPFVTNCLNKVINKKSYEKDIFDVIVSYDEYDNTQHYVVDGKHPSEYRKKKLHSICQALYSHNCEDHNTVMVDDQQDNIVEDCCKMGIVPFYKLPTSQEINRYLDQMIMFMTDVIGLRPVIINTFRAYVMEQYTEMVEKFAKVEMSVEEINNQALIDDELNTMFNYITSKIDAYRH